ncbi:MAG: hypothetical protein GOMPHAMPRED_005731 [Gomphillus americanus]|uniref:Kinetochore protein mis14 n=1 Tax=Gomphillus americanus TaxID=1940652 RepID=A0A8H3FWZ4_9LECA|nr:MAG: hypothetical protein GOMPHAMPRED_005731 [Gomphillus americanus]
MSEHQRKVELQSHGDLIYLQNAILIAAHQKIDLHLPPSAAQGTEDDFRNKVTALVEQYVHDTLNLALPSLSINGLDTTPSSLSSSTDSPDLDSSHYEAYDTHLAQRLRELYATLEAETTKVASLRRAAPKRAADEFIAALNQDIEAGDREYQARRMELGQWEPPLLQDVGFGDRDDVQQAWDAGVRDLDALRNVTKVKADLERAIRVATEVEKR